MLQQFITQFISEMGLGSIDLSTETPGTYAIPLEEGLKITLSDLPEGFSLKCALAPYPKTQEEIFSTQALLSNLFGQGTQGAVLGLTNDGNTLTLIQNIDYNINYKVFKEILEDFINSVDFWREQALNHK